MTTEITRPLVEPRTARADQVRGDYLMLRVSLLAVIGYVSLGLLGFAVFAGFWPPPAEDLKATEIAAYFADNETRLRIGMVLMAAGAPLYYAWSVALSRIIGRIEGPMGPLSSIELLGGPPRSGSLPPSGWRRDRPRPSSSCTTSAGSSSTSPSCAR